MIRSKQLALAAVILAPAPASAAVMEWTTASGGNGHFYEFVAVNVNYDTARAGALARTHNDLQGYLATVTSQAENDFLLSFPGNIGWVGATEAVEGVWSWSEGPEAGTVFWQNGVTLTYANWGAGEPNNFRGINENRMVIRFGQQAKWNDLPPNESQGYYVEYSAAPMTGGVPEPATWAMMLLGFAGLGGALRRARRMGGPALA